jgi:DNA modification methylase
MDYRSSAMSIRIITGDCRDVLASLPAESVHCVVTSPPYWGLRDYNIGKDAFGLEPTIDLYVRNAVEIFRAVHRVLRPDGTLWLNLGDSYATGTTAERKPTRWGKHGYWQSPEIRQRIDGAGSGPQAQRPLRYPLARVAFALQGDGWWLRQDIVWSKPNPMPESVTDRCTKAHEYIFMLSKSARYYYDAEAVKEPMKDVSLQRLSQPNVFDQPGGPKNPKEGNRSHRKAINNQAERLVKHEKWKTRFDGWDKYDKSLGRNKRSVWEVATQPFSEAHFATFPPALIEPAILAGCPPGGTVLDPFGGAGTAGLVADRLQRNAVLVELNPDYVAMAERRIRNDAPLFATAAGVVAK